MEPASKPNPIQSAASGQTSTPEQLVDSLNGVFGKQQPGVRATHAKGMDVEGMFEPSDSASSLSKAPHLQRTSVPITVRFSDFTGIPSIPDADPLASPRGMAIRFHLPNDVNTDIVSHSYNGFPTATVDEFRELMLALAASGPNAPKPTPLQTFLAVHPIAKTFLESQIPPPVSYGTVTYFGVNTFKFTNSAGDVTFGRYQIRPDAGNHSLPLNQVVGADPNYLSKELAERLAEDSVTFKLMLQIAEEGDRLDDPSIAWPDTRQQVELGTIEITDMVADSAAAERQIVFGPASLVDGIETADPMIAVRQKAYFVSYERRTKREEAAA